MFFSIKYYLRILANCCRNHKNLLGHIKFSLTYLLHSKFHYFAFDATLTVTIQLSVSLHCEQSRTTSTSKTPNSITKIIYISPFISDFANRQTAFFTGIPTSVEFCNRILCVALNRHTTPFAVFLIWPSLARATENYLWIQ